MDRYDWGWSRNYGQRYGRDYGPRYGRDYGMRQPGRYGGDFSRGPWMRGLWGPGPGPGFPLGYERPRPDYGPHAAGGRPRYDREMYGSDYPGFGRMRYDRAFADRPFMPETAYRQHPEFGRPRREAGDRWAERGHSTVYGQVDDDEIRSSVEQNLMQDGWVDATSIQVDVEDQVVTLSGEVGDYLEARYVWDDAWEAMGVRGVINNLTVRLEEPSGEHHDLFPQEETPSRKSQGGKGKRPRK